MTTVVRGYDKAQLYGKLLDLLERNGGMTGSAISDKLDVSRITMSKYLSAFASDGMIHSKNIGNSTMWYVTPSAVRFEFPSDYARAAELYSGAVSELSDEKAGSVLGSCMSCGASAVTVLSEVLSPAIEMTQKMYDSGKIGSAEESFMHSIISHSAIHIGDTHRDDQSFRHAILLATDPKSALYARVVSGVLSHNGWHVMQLGNMSHAVGVLLDTEIKKLLVRVQAPDDGITMMVVFSSTVDGLRAFGTAADSARQGTARGVLLGLCGPVGHNVASDASVTRADDIIHWADSL